MTLARPTGRGEATRHEIRTEEVPVSNPLRAAPYPALSGPFAAPPGHGDVVPSPAIARLVGTQVRALLESSPAFHELSPAKQEAMRRDMEKIAAYSAALIRDDWATSERLGQTPVLRERTVLDLVPRPTENGGRRTAGALAKEPPAPPPVPADQFDPRAASQAAKLTRDTLNAIAFPTFVADLIKGTFQAIVDASIQQMEAYGALLANVAKTVDQFMADNISDNNARDFLVQSYPGHFRLDTTDGPRLRVRDKADDLAKPDFRSSFNLSEDVPLDDDAAEQTLVPAARRQLAQNRHSMLSTMVLMGINRIVITSGRITAKMGFRINTKDTGRAESASDFDFKNETSAAMGGFMGGFGGIAAGYSHTRTTVAYVSSSKKDSSDSIDLSADLTGEVDLKFKSDYFPMERFAKPEMIALIQGHTPNPTANAPVTANANTAGTGVGAPAPTGNPGGP
jgi:hypothetical protein